MFALGLTLATLSSTAVAQLRVTEVLSQQSAGAPTAADDFWELTNFGAATVNLNGWAWDDNSFNPNDPSAVQIGNIDVAPGESIIFTGSDTATDFRNWWGIAASVQVIAGGPGLGMNDAVALYDAGDAEVLRFSYAAAGFTRSNGTPSLGGHAGPSAGAPNEFTSVVYDPNFDVASPRYTFAQVGQFGAFQATGTATDVGSPGVVPEPAAISILAVAAMMAIRRR
jgi:hypothetical protein